MIEFCRKSTFSQRECSGLPDDENELMHDENKKNVKCEITKQITVSVTGSKKSIAKTSNENLMLKHVNYTWEICQFDV
jgi:hypothetical protein